jgi:hypothetical protein
MPTFQNTLFVPSSVAYEDGADRVFRNVVTYTSDAGKSPRRNHRQKAAYEDGTALRNVGT